MIVRRFKKTDAPEVGKLFYDTVHTINAQDYAPQLIDMWAPRNDEFTRLVASCENNIFFVVEKNGILVGFGDMTHGGYLERLFVHKDFQGQKIGITLLNALEYEAKMLDLAYMSTEASVRSMPFFRKHGFLIVRTIKKDHPYEGLIFTTYKMKKKLLV